MFATEFLRDHYTIVSHISSDIPTLPNDAVPHLEGKVNPHHTPVSTDCCCE